VRASLSTLNRGFEGKQTMTPEMDALAQSLFDDALPAAWAAASWTAACSLADWLQDLLRRVDQLKQWLAAPESPPAVLWIGGLFSPQRYLTAVLQRSAQLQRVDLSDLMLVTEVTRHSDADQDGLAPPSRDSVLIKGLTLEGARFDAASGMIADMRNGESAKSTLPIVSVRAVPKSEQIFAGVHVCPVYKVKARGESWVFDVALKTKSPPQKWIIAGVALILE
jgi:dynein heavy chain